MPRNLESELASWDGEWPACWKPREGEMLVGTVLLYSTGQSSYGPVRTCIVQRDDGSRVSVWLSSVMLLGLFQDQRPKVGERLGLRYLGKHVVKGYRRYALLVDRDGQELDFGPLGGEKGSVDEVFDDPTDPFGQIPAQAGRR